jgi:hypothetical protein
MMHGDRIGADSQKFELPPELVAELQRSGPAKKIDMNMDHWKPSLVDRFFALFSGRKSR